MKINKERKCMVEKKKILYAPWRQEYLSSNLENKSKFTKTCSFCNIKKVDPDLLVLDGKTCYIQANKFPYATGHLLIIPKRHVNDINSLTTIERVELFNLMDLSIFALKIFMKPEGYNIGCSVGKVAGESMLHLHFHVLPRFSGDVGWDLPLDFKVCSISPKELTNKLKNIIIKEKLLKKFDIS